MDEVLLVIAEEADLAVADVMVVVMVCRVVGMLQVGD
jgi:hypothetical protein